MNAHIAGYNDGLAPAWFGVDADLETASPAQLKWPRRNRALQPFARRSVCFVVAEAREFLTLHDQRVGVGKQARSVERSRRACVKQQLERLARRGFERAEQPLVDRRICAGDAQIDFGAGRESVQSPSNRGFRTVGAVGGQALHHQVVVAKLDDRAHIFELIGELFERARSFVEHERSRRLQRARLASGGWRTTIDVRVDVNRPRGDVEIREDLGRRARKLQRVGIAFFALGRAEVADRQRKRERSDLRSGGDPGIAVIPFKGGQERLGNGHAELALERDGQHAGVRRVGAEFAGDMFEANLVLFKNQSSRAQSHARRGLEVDGLAVGESTPRIVERVATERVGGNVHGNTLEVDERGGCDVGAVGEFRLGNAALETKPAGPGAHGDRRDGELAAVDHKVVDLDRSSVGHAVERAGDVGDGETALGVGAAKQREIQRRRAARRSCQCCAKAEVTEFAVTVVGHNAVLEDEILDGDFGRPLRTRRRTRGFGGRSEGEQRKFARPVRRLRKPKLNTIGLHRANFEFADEKRKQREVAADAIGVNEFARNVVPAARANSKVLHIDRVDAGEGDARCRHIATDRLSHSGKNDAGESRGAGEVDEPRECCEPEEHAEAQPPSSPPTPTLGGQRVVAQSWVGLGGVLRVGHRVGILRESVAALTLAYDRRFQSSVAGFRGRASLFQAMHHSNFAVGPHGTALVTGASHRVGRAVAVELARQGMGLVLTYFSRAAECAQTAQIAKDQARACGHEISTRVDQLDLSDVKAATAYAQELRGACAGGALDCIVHNASSYHATPFDSIDADAVESMNRIEVVSPLLITKGLREELARSRLGGVGGAVVFFSDIHALGRARVGFAGYLLAKASVQTLARQLAVELAPKVRVHCVAPGVVMWPEDFSEEGKRAILARTPLGRAGTPEEVARLVRFLVMEATYLTGSTIAIDGGRALR
ncbi:MAG: SDR family oxidoreductase [Planctomycetota bacterium]|nr:MAG: SDR family oxidoreductase [Planctomycetota bacterium]